MKRSSSAPPMSVRPSSACWLVGLAALAACGDGESTNAPEPSSSAADTGAVPIEGDRDLDGVLAQDGDCDDTNSTVYPGARERSFDGLDSDCDGEDMPSLGDDRYQEALSLMDDDEDGEISFEEFSAACADAALLTTGRPGMVQVHAACSGTVMGRGMHLHPWDEFFVHDCRGVNYCSSWSCTETAEDQQTSGADALMAAGCLNCHNTSSGAFKVYVPPGRDSDEVLAELEGLSDERFLAVVAFGIGGVNPSGVAHQNMPSHFERVSRREMVSLMEHVRTMELVAEPFEYGESLK